MRYRGHRRARIGKGIEMPLRESRLSDLPFAPENTAPRVLAVLMHSGLRKNEFAKLIELAPSNLTQLIQGVYAPSPPVAYRIKRAFGVAGEWLLFGEADGIKDTKLRFELLQLMPAAKAEFEASQSKK